MGRKPLLALVGAVLAVAAACTGTASEDEAAQLASEAVAEAQRSSDQTDVVSDGPDTSDESTPTSSSVVTEVVGWGSSWSFDADGTEDDDWRSPAFDDLDWQVGEAPFGRDEVATTEFATPESGTTGWLRHRFTVDDPAAVEQLILQTIVDDGFVAFINGIEVSRWNLPDGPLTADTRTVERITGEDESIVQRRADLPTDVLVPGENVIAVAVHQGAADSSDMRFDLRLAIATRLG